MQATPTFAARLLRNVALLFMAALLVSLFGCAVKKTAQGLAGGVISRALDPSLQLTTSSLEFRHNNGRWPENYGELRSFNESHLSRPLTNFTSVSFSTNLDGSLHIYAVSPETTNDLTITPTDANTCS